MLAILAYKLNLGFSKCWSFLRLRLSGVASAKSGRKLGLVSFIILASLIVVVLVAGTNVAHAFWDTVENGVASLLLVVAGWFIKLTFFILKFVIEVAGYNGFIDSPAVIVGWVMVRDVTNMFFVVVLLLISFGTILGLEQYEYKKLLIKLLMAAVIINFSRIICGIIIDVAQVVMITFVNGIVATASGNLVNMFKIDKIFALTGGADGVAQKSSSFLVAVAAISFAAIMMMTMLTFLFLLMARMMALWILIVLSPFAFVLNVLPQTQKYAGQWWTEFGGNVVAGPIVAFFLWLSFVTVGAGNAHDTIRDNNALSNQNLIDNGDNDPKEESTGIGSIMTWASMANFAIAIGMLLTGAKIAQQLGAAGGAMMGKAGEFGKKVAMAASGITAARWAGRKGWEVAKKKAPIIGTESLDRKWRTIKAVGGRIKKTIPIIGDIDRTKGAKWLGKSGEKALNWGAARVGKEGATWKDKLLGSVVGLGGGMLGKTVGKVVEGVVETSARAEKRTKKREDFVKELEKAEDMEMGFSETGLGKALTKQQATNKNREEKKETDKARNMLNARADDFDDKGEPGKANALRLQAQSLELEKAREITKGLSGKELVASATEAAKVLQAALASGDEVKIDDATQKMFVARSSAQKYDPWVSETLDRKIQEIMKISDKDKQAMTSQQWTASLDSGKIVKKADDVGRANTELEKKLGGNESAQSFLRDRDQANDVALGRGRKDVAGTMDSEFKNGRMNYSLFKGAEKEQKDKSQNEFNTWSEKISARAMPNAGISNLGRNSDGKIAVNAFETCADEFKILLSRLGTMTANQFSQITPMVQDLSVADPHFKMQLLSALKGIEGADKKFVSMLENKISPSTAPPQTSSGGGGGGNPHEEVEE